MADLPDRPEPWPNDVTPEGAATWDALVVELRELIGRLRALHLALARCPDPGGVEEQELLRLIARRDDLAGELGRELVRWMARGGEVALHGASDRAPVPAPEAAMAAPSPADRDADGAPSAGARPTESPEVTADVPPVAVGAVPPVPAAEVVVLTPPPASESPPANPAALLALAQSGLSPKWSTSSNAADRQRALRGLLRELGGPDELAALRSHRVVARLTGAAGRMDAWLGQPKEAQRALIGLVSSLARHIQDLGELGAEDSAALQVLFSRMTRWSGEHRPGFVSGLSRSNAPEHGSWIGDAQHWWSVLQDRAYPTGPDVDVADAHLRNLEDQLELGADRKTVVRFVEAAVRGGVSQSDSRLVALLTPQPSILRGARGLKTLKTRVKQAVDAEGEEQETQDASSPLPADWPFFALTRGATAAIVGGDPRPQASRRIEGAFQFGGVTWEPTDVRRVEALAQRIRQRNVALVILLRRFIGHWVQDLIMPACTEAGVAVVVVESGYGVSQVKRAIERYLAGWLDATRDNEAGST